MPASRLRKSIRVWSVLLWDAFPKVLRDERAEALTNDNVERAVVGAAVMFEWASHAG